MPDFAAEAPAIGIDGQLEPLRKLIVQPDMEPSAAVREIPDEQAIGSRPGMWMVAGMRTRVRRSLRRSSMPTVQLSRLVLMLDTP